MIMKRSASYERHFFLAIELKTLIEMNVWCVCAFISVVTVVLSSFWHHHGLYALRKADFELITHYNVLCVCVNSTSGGGRSLATPAYQSRLALVSHPLGAAVNKIKSATLTLPSAQGRQIARLHPTFPRHCCSTDTQSRTKLQSSSSSSTNAGPAGPCAGRSKPLSFTKSKSIG